MTQSHSINSLIHFLNRYAIFLFLSLLGLSTQLRAADAGIGASVDFAVGSDSNVYEEEPSEGDTYYSVKPALSYGMAGFAGKAFVEYKDFADSKNSAQAKKANVGAELGYTGVFYSLKSETNSSFGYTSKRTQRSGSLEGLGANVFDFKISQGLGFDLGQLSIGGKIGFDRQDSDQIQSDDTPDVIEISNYVESYSKLYFSFNVTAKFNENVAFSVEPSVTQKVYDESPARQTEGQGGIGALGTDREYLDNTLVAALPITVSNFELKPSFTFGMRNDRAFGGEDNSSTGFGIVSSIKIPQAYGLKLSAGYAHAQYDYDNWTDSLKAGESLREDTEDTLSLGASLNFNPNFSFALAYSDYTIESTRTSAAVNYDRQITSGTLTAKF